MTGSISVSPVVFSELSLTSHNLSTVLDSMGDDLWEDFSRFVNIPHFEVKRIRSKYSSDKECKQAGIDYLISSHPAPAWRVVAHALYRMGHLLLLTKNIKVKESDSCLRALACLQQLFPTGICYSFW